MGVWIRSQDGSCLINVAYVKIGQDDCDGMGILGYFAGETFGELLGEYPTEAQALKVLDEIQKQIEAIAYFKARSNSDMPCPDAVYQMPPAEEVSP